MTPEIMQQLVRLSKKYARIDYDDDDELVETMVNICLDEMAEVIPAFDRDNLTPRQKLLLYRSVKSRYDDREKYGTEQQTRKLDSSSMLLSEIYEPKGAISGE